ncbi:ATP-binding protein [Pseudomonas hunanensis]|uniref:ATP-binding protein n=1 Tax=Pseudomonas hunanensis TaxID=1247546 RepID=UPI002405209E|nr:AAA family ATPase [Pseudomonas hunanensis]MDF9756804.1 ABC-type cobalamin/Fe3+-siderophores transport system ATPase subunit [Pseudomonas hunanensis]
MKNLIELHGVYEFKGFILGNDFSSECNVVVLTGANGCGKTRFLESMTQGSTEVKWNGDVIAGNKIRFYSAAVLVPRFDQHVSLGPDREIDAAVNFFESNKEAFHQPYNEKLNLPKVLRGSQDSPSYKLVHLQVGRIAELLGKERSQVCAADVQLLYDVGVGDVMALPDVSKLSNAYLLKVERNLFNMWRHERFGEEDNFVPLDKVEDYFGPKPWVLFNEILEVTFDGKFRVNEPSLGSSGLSYKAELQLQSKMIPIELSALSSGEQVLLWLSMHVLKVQLNSSPEDRSPTVLLFDEPDNSLHPKMTFRLLDMFEKLSERFNLKVFLTTHSPTTVALAKDEAVYMVSEERVSKVKKDFAISQLLDGVSQISISPENRREVFVESQSDADVFQVVFNFLRSRSKVLDPMISMVFIPSGPKMAEGLIEQKLRQVFNEVSDGEVAKFKELVNGVGDYGRVVGTVEALKGSRTVRGIVDWDGKNKPTEKIVVSGEGVFYTLENIVLDPILVTEFLVNDRPDLYPVSYFCGAGVDYQAWRDSVDFLQISVDTFIAEILGRNNRRDVVVDYVGGMKILSDAAYVGGNGHALKELILEKYHPLRKYSMREGALLNKVVHRLVSIIGETFIPAAFERTFKKIQEA